MSDFNKLMEQKAQLQEKLETLEAEEAVLRGSLQRVRDEKEEIVEQQKAIQTQAEELFRNVFGGTSSPPSVVVSLAPAAEVAPTAPRKPDNSIVPDYGAPSTDSAEVAAVKKLGGFAF